jgi:triosephosphate isomerase
MHRTVRESVELIRQLKPLVEASRHCDVVVAPPFTALWAAAREARGSVIAVAAQDLYWESQGAFTGEVSPGMVAEAGCRYAILGHSERRSLFGETSRAVSRKAAAALKAGLAPIVCLGEHLQEVSERVGLELEVHRHRFSISQFQHVPGRSVRLHFNAVQLGLAPGVVLLPDHASGLSGCAQTSGP